MDKKKKSLIIALAFAILCGIIGFLAIRMHNQKKESDQMLELAEMDKREMQNEYEQFAMQYNEMKTQIKNDSLVAQLEKEQQRTEELLEELKRVKSSDAAEIMRLKKELATLRKVLKSFMPNGYCKVMPAQVKKRQIVYEEIYSQFKPGATYTEKEVNETIMRMHDDYCTVRRAFVGMGWMSRDKGIYTVAESKPEDGRLDDMLR